MQEEPFSNREIREFLDRFHEEMKTGFEGIHKRQDVTNGRIGKAELKIEEGEKDIVRLETLINNHIMDIDTIKNKSWDVAKILLPWVLSSAVFFIAYWITTQ